MEVRYLFFRDSEMLCDIFEQLTLQSINYAVARNYRALPDKITGDIDLIMQRGDFISAAVIIKKVANTHGWKVFVEYDGAFSYHLGLQNHERYPERFYLLIEFFDGGTWRGLRYYDTDKMLKTQKKIAGISCLDPKVEAFYTLTHHLLYNKIFPEKYEYLWDSLPCWRDREYLNYRSYPLILVYYLLSFYKFKRNNLLSNIVRVYLILLSFSLNPLCQISNLALLRNKTKAKPKGILISLEGDDDTKLKLSRDIIEYAKRYHITIPPMKKSFVLESVDLRQVQKIIQSGGLVILSNSDLYQNDQHIKRNIERYIFIDINLKTITFFKGQFIKKIDKVEIHNIDLIWSKLIALLTEMKA